MLIICFVDYVNFALAHNIETYQRVKATSKARPSQRFPETACFYNCHIRYFSPSMALDGVWLDGWRNGNTLKINAKRGEGIHINAQQERHDTALFSTHSLTQNDTHARVINVNGLYCYLVVFPCLFVRIRVYLTIDKT
jgi:hypothetical protein